MTIDLKISLTNQSGYVSDLYPNEVNMNQNDHRIGETLYEKYRQAQEKFIPYYLIAIITTRNSRSFGVFDGVTFYNEVNDFQSSPLNALQSIHYFAIDCFGVSQDSFLKGDKKHLFEPIKLENSSQKFKLFPLNFDYPAKFNFKKNPSGLKQLELDKLMIRGLSVSVNNLSATHSKIAEKIESKEIFSGLETERRDIEVMKWGWCSLMNGSNDQMHMDEINELCTQKFMKIARLINQNHLGTNKILSKL